MVGSVKKYAVPVHVYIMTYYCSCPEEMCGSVDYDKIQHRCMEHGSVFGESLVAMRHTLEDCPYKDWMKDE